MGSCNGTRRKLVKGLVLYTDELYYKSYAGEPTLNLVETADRDVAIGEGGYDVTTGGDFYRIYRDEDPHQQGMYKSLAPGTMKDSDVVYKHNFPTSNQVTVYKHGFKGIYLDIGSEYTLSAEVFVSEHHTRTGISNRAVLQASAVNQASQYGAYDFSKKGTWQVVSVLIKPSLLSGTDASSGSSGSAGTSGTSGVIQTSLYYSVYMYPRANYPYQTSQNSNGHGGYILYKNLQLERNKPEYAGSTHRTQFIRGRRSNTSGVRPERTASSGLKDISGNNNSLNIANCNFDSEAKPIFSKRGSDGAYQNIGLTSTAAGSSSALTLGSTTSKTYDFWVKLTSVSDEQSTLFYSDITRDGKFTGDDNVSKKQRIYIFEGRVYCDFYSSGSISTSSFTSNEVVLANRVHNIAVVVNASLNTFKVKIYVDGHLQKTTRVSNLQPPSSLILKSFNPENQIKESFKVGTTLNYRISSYNDEGESGASVLRKILIKNSNSVINLTWGNVPQATQYYVYRSINALSRFQENSLLTKVDNPFFGGKSVDKVSFQDNNTSLVEFGSPKDTNAYDKYSLTNSSFHDGSDMKVAIGSAPMGIQNAWYYGANYAIAPGGEKSFLGQQTHGTDDDGGKEHTEKYGSRAKGVPKQYAEGKIYKISIYNKALDSKDILYSFVQGAEDFDFASSESYNLGGYGGG
jgi:hypothetical protein